MKPRPFLHRLFLPAVLRALCGLLLPFHLAPAAPELPPFTARFESDAQGTWFCYPTIPGCHYRIESTPTLNGTDYIIEPGTFFYGNAFGRRWWIAPPPPPSSGPATPPPARSVHSLHLTLRIARDSTPTEVEVLRLHPDHPWSVRITAGLPVRPFLVPFLGVGNTPTERWTISGVAHPVLISSFTLPAGAPVFESGSPEQDEYEFLMAHWPDVIDQLTPPPNLIPVEVPPLPASSDPPDFTVRRFFRVQRVEVDTNINTIPDWYELQFGYNPFAQPDTGNGAQPGYYDPYGDDDCDGLINSEEFLVGTNPLLYDTDGDLALDGQEVYYHTDPNKATSTPTLLVGVERYIYDDRGISNNPFSWRTWALMRSAPLPGSASCFGQTPVYSDPGPGSVFNHSYPDFRQWHEHLATAVFPEQSPWWAPDYRHAEPSRTILPVDEDHPFQAFGSPVSAGVINLPNENADNLHQDRLWLRGDVAPAGGFKKTYILRKERITGYRTGDPWAAHPYEYETTNVSYAPFTFVIPAGSRISSNFCDMVPDFSTEPATDPSPPWLLSYSTHFHLVRWRLLPLQINTYKRGTLNSPGAAVPHGTGEFGDETVVMENADSESSDTSTSRDCDLNGDLNTYRKEHDDDLVKVVFTFPKGAIFPKGANIPGISLRVAHAAMKVDAAKSLADGALTVGGESHLKFYRADGTRITTPETDLYIPDIASPPADRYLSRVLTDGEVTLFVEGGDHFGDLPNNEMDRLGGAQLRWEIQQGTEVSSEKLLIYRGGFLRFLQPRGAPGTLGTFEFRDGKGRIRHRTGNPSYGNEFATDDTDNGSLIASWTAKSGKTYGNRDYRTPKGNGHTPLGWWRLTRRNDINGPGQPDKIEGSGSTKKISQGGYVRWKQDDETAAANRYTTPYRYDASNAHDAAIGEPTAIKFKYDMTEIGSRTSGRTDIQIHPDGECTDPVMAGTAGCIGIQKYNACVEVDSILKGYHGLKVKVQLQQ